MIANDWQRSIKAKQLTVLRSSVRNLIKHPCPNYMWPPIYHLQKKATENLIDNLTEEIEQYDKTKKT